MSHPSPSSPQREIPMSQDEEFERIVSQMDWDDEGDTGVEHGDDEGPQEGQGAYVAGVWCDPIDLHLFGPKRRCLLSDIDPDYVSSPVRVRTYNRAFIIHFQGIRVISCRIWVRSM